MSELLKSFIIWHVFWSISLTFSFTLSVSNGFSGCYAICRQKIGQITPVEEFAVVVLFWFLSRLHPIAIYSYCILAIPIENARKNVYYMSVTYLKCFDITMSTHTHTKICVFFYAIDCKSIHIWGFLWKWCIFKCICKIGAKIFSAKFYQDQSLLPFLLLYVECIFALLNLQLYRRKQKTPRTIENGKFF